MKGFDDALSSAEHEWQDLLGRVEIEGGRQEDRTTFYTALYHAAIHPNIASDVDNSYLRFPSANASVTFSDKPMYTVFSMWDTYRSLHPLLVLLYPEQQMALLDSIVDMTKSGAPPKWELWG